MVGSVYRRGVRLAPGVLCLALLSPGSSSAIEADPGEALSRAVRPLAGLGFADITAYRVPFRTPLEESEGEVGFVELEESWSGGELLGIRSPEGALPGAVVRGIAFYLEPLFSGRAVLHRLLAEAGALADAGNALVEWNPPESREALQVTPRDGVDALDGVERVDIALDTSGRLLSLAADLGEEGVFVVQCEWAASGLAPQPEVLQCRVRGQESAEWRTRFESRFELRGKRWLPVARVLTMPDRFDPALRESLVVEYGDYDLSRGIPEGGEIPVFLFDSDGLRSED
ncbi:MAG: hypothetical protein QF819_09370 [Gemmatimonadota bacterium]|nr:hypothetical protein [Gemmatimonadota bacterium]MDP6803360.1 hypothetical protein [Gemmatimonadota bacterium]MDP7032627.1 hypothetical protein [Gemmatimonadota bacterium]